MLHIAICDDDGAAAQSIQSMVETCLKQCGCAGKIAVYTVAGNLLYDIVEDRFFFDLLLLDIEMPGVSGMAIAEKIQPCLPHAKVIFITSHIEYAIDAFALSIFRYVPKGELQTRLPAALRDAFALLSLEEGRTYTIRTHSRLEKIPYKEIYFIEREGKNARITTFAGVSRVRKSLQEVYDELGAEEFLFIDRGCIVNIIHILQVKDGMAMLKNGASLPISRSHLQAVKEQINRYWGNTYDGWDSFPLSVCHERGAHGRLPGNPPRPVPPAVPKEMVGRGHRRRRGRIRPAVRAARARSLSLGAGSPLNRRLRPLRMESQLENQPVRGDFL